LLLLTRPLAQDAATGQSMTNVIDFQTKPRRGRALAPPSGGAGLALHDRGEPVRGRQLRVKAEVCKSIMLLDLAAQHAREIETRVTDPEVRRAFGRHVDAIEEAIQIARENARDF
jgi:hypothetical protein